MMAKKGGAPAPEAENPVGEDAGQDNAAVEVTDDEDGNEFSMLYDQSFDDGDDEPVSAPAPTEAPEEAPAEEPAAEEVEAGSAPQAQPTAAPTPAPATEAPVSEAAPATQQGEGPSPDGELTREQLQAQYDQRVAAMTEQLASHYALTPEQVEELETDPTTALPRMAARLHMEVLQAAVLNAARMLPDLVRNVTAVQQQAVQRETSFFERWPALKDHREAILRFGRVYRQQNPQAPADQFINDVGAMVSAALRLPLQQQVTPPPAPRPQPQPPFQSAAGGRQPAPRQRPTNEFEALDEIIEQIR